MQEKKDKTIIERLEDKISESLSGAGIFKVIAGVSGGADSVALLRGLVNIGVDVEVVHCNFHLRGEESERDRKFVEILCSDLGVSLDVVDFDVESYRRVNGGSVEMACRELRYAYFEEKMETLHADRIAVAHNSDDNAETLLLNLFRGAGISGLRAMKPDTGRVVRPLLDISRSEIEEYLDALKQDYIVDSSNLTSDYKRNFIRNEVIPLIEKEWPGVKRSLNKTAEIMRDEEDGINGVTRVITNDNRISYETMLEKDTGKWYLRRFVISKGGSNDIVEQMWAVLTKPDIRKGAKWITAKGEFVLSSDGLEWLEGEILPEGFDLSDEFEWEQFRNSQALMDEIKADRSNRILWIPIPPDDVKLRTREKGDRIKPLGMKGSRLVSDIIGESRLTVREKRKIAIAQNVRTNEIIWVENLKRSRKDLISLSDENIWRLKRKSRKS